VDFRCGNPPWHFSQLKTRTIPLIGTQSGQELCRPQYIVHRIFIENSLHKKNQIWKLIFDTLLWTWGAEIHIVRVFNWLKCQGGFPHLKSTVGCQISTLIFKFSFVQGSLWISHQKYIKESKVLTNLGFQSKVLAWPLTNWSTWVGFCTSSPHKGVKYQLGYLILIWDGSL
jgi:hypothetical protein